MISLSMWNVNAVNLIEMRVKCGEGRWVILISYHWIASRISGMLPQRSVTRDKNKHLEQRILQCFILKK